MTSPDMVEVTVLVRGCDSVTVVSVLKLREAVVVRDCELVFDISSETVEELLGLREREIEPVVSCVKLAVSVVVVVFGGELDPVIVSVRTTVLDGEVVSDRDTGTLCDWDCESVSSALMVTEVLSVTVRVFEALSDVLTERV